MLEFQLRGWEETYGTGGKGITHSGRFMEVIQRAYEKTGRGVVVLIDEYDKPLLNSFQNEDLQRSFRDTLTAFYSVLKSADQWLRFVFITGVTKFAQMGIFSNLNQLNDISLDIDYATLCGITREEIAEILTHAAFYAGWPKAWAAFRMAKEVWSEEAGEDGKAQHQQEMVFPIGAPNDGFAQYFVGQSYLHPLSTSQVGVYNVTFEPGCRNNWHIHQADQGGGQILICVAGRGYYQECA